MHLFDLWHQQVLYPLCKTQLKMRNDLSDGCYAIHAFYSLIHSISGVLYLCKSSESWCLPIIRALILSHLSINTEGVQCRRKQTYCQLQQLHITMTTLWQNTDLAMLDKNKASIYDLLIFTLQIHLPSQDHHRIMLHNHTNDIMDLLSEQYPVEAQNWALEVATVISNPLYACIRLFPISRITLAHLRTQ